MGGIAVDQPIGVFDSGIGGLSVLRHIHTHLSHEHLLYAADSGFAPYGEKPEPAIACFDKVLARQPGHETATFGKAVSQQLLWKFDEATTLYLKILEKNPQSEECLVNLITIGMARKDHALIQHESDRERYPEGFRRAGLD